MSAFLKELKNQLKNTLENIGQGIYGIFACNCETELRAQQRKQEQARAKAQMMALFAGSIDIPYVWQESEAGETFFKIKDGYYEMMVDKPAFRTSSTHTKRKRKEPRRKKQQPVVQKVVINHISVSDTHNFYASVGQVANNMSNNIKEQQKGE